jgi:hypothetical protein
MTTVMTTLTPVVDRAALSINLTRYKDTIFVPLPRALWQPINGSCCCDWCKAHPECEPAYDTMVIGAKAPKRGYNDYTSLCHYPEIANPLGKTS